MVTIADTLYLKSFRSIHKAQEFSPEVNSALSQSFSSAAITYTQSIDQLDRTQSIVLKTITDSFHCADTLFVHFLHKQIITASFPAIDGIDGNVELCSPTHKSET